MALTKTGSLAPQVLGQGKGLLGFLGGTGKFLGRTADKAYRSAKGVARTGVKGAVGTAKLIEKHPKTGLGILGAGLYTSYKLPSTTKKLMAHSDPNQNFTYRTPLLGKVKYNTAHPAFGENARQFAEDKNRFF